MRDRSYENQRHRASDLNLLVAAIILWNTTYLQRAVDHLRIQGHHPASGDLAHLSPLGWEHINLILLHQLAKPGKTNSPFFLISS
jgi:Tn3 transposase DDE domain